MTREDIPHGTPNWVLAALLAAFVAVIAGGTFFVWILFSDDAFRESQFFGGEAKVIQYEFRRHFYGRATYPAYTLSELESRGILSPHACEFLREFHARYRPFTPETPPDTVVLRLRGGILGTETIKLTKEELTGDPKR